MRDLSEAIAEVPGVSIDSGVAKPNGYSLTIRGSSDVLMLSDGKRINALGGEVFPNGYNSTSSFIPPLSAIERIEVIRGPASTLYGSDAMGGVVNIITKKSFDEWGASFKYDYTLQERKLFPNNQSFSFYTAGPLNEAKNWGLTLRGRQWAQASVLMEDLPLLGANNTNVATAGALVGVAPGQIYQIGGRLQWNSLNSVGGEPQNSVYLDLDYGAQYWDNSQGLLVGNWNPTNASTVWTPGSSPDRLRTNQGYDTDHNIHRYNVVLSHLGHYIYSPNSVLGFLKTDTSLQYNAIQNNGRTVASNTMPSGASTTGANGVMAGENRKLFTQDAIFDHKTNMVFNFGSVAGLNLSIGGRYWYSSFRDKLLQVSTGKDKKDQHLGALFAEGEFMLFNRVFLTLGGRGNFSSIFGANFSPRAYLAINAIDEWLVFKGGVSTGYKTPALNYLINGIVAISGTGSRPSYGNTDLKPETSVNYELSALSNNEFFNTSLTGFYTEFKDRISSVSGIQNGSLVGNTGFVCAATGKNANCSYYINVEKAKSYGAEFALGIKPINVGYGDISFNAAYTFTKTKITKAQSNASIGTRLSNVPLHAVNATLNYDTRYFGVYIKEEYKAGLYRAPGSDYTNAINTLGENYEPYYLTHLGLYVKPIKNLQVNFAVYNLFDFNFLDYNQEVYDSLVAGEVVTHRALYYANDYNYIREGRRYYLSFQLDF